MLVVGDVVALEDQRVFSKEEKEEPEEEHGGDEERVRWVEEEGEEGVV